MTEGHCYTATSGDTRFETRNVIHISHTEINKLNQNGKRIVVPFSGFDGQALAGKGALVFEGELLELRN